jgi:glycosyltransferase involved in cell wall biosynthesis
VSRVLHVITGLAAGGAEHQLRLLLTHSADEAEVVTLTNAGSVAEAIRAAGIPVTDLRMRGNRDLLALPRLVRLIRRGHYDVVHTHLYRACVYGRLAARLAGVRHVVATEHSLGATRIEGRPITAGVRRLYRATERLGQHTVAVSGPVATRLVEWGVRPERVTVIPNGIDTGALAFDAGLRDRTRAGLGLWPSERVVGAVGRLDAGKRFDVLLRAMAGLDATLLLVGAGPERAALEALAARLGLADRVRFAGEVADVRPLLCAMDVLAAPSAEETFGLAVLEALACGLPVVYGSCPALEALPAGAAPLAVHGAIDETDLRAELGSALDTAVLAAAVDRPGRRDPPPAVEHYRIDRLAGRISALYQEIQHGKDFRWHLQPSS